MEPPGQNVNAGDAPGGATLLGLSGQTNARYGLGMVRAMATQPGIAQRLVGRQAELEVIQAHIDAALGGEGQVLVASGEAGVGKSRLLAELARRFSAAAPNALVLTGNCFEGDRALAYAPLLDLLRGHISNDSDGLQLLLALDPAAFASLLPELQARWPDVAPLDGADPQADKQRVFQALLGLFRRLAADRPLLIILEDLHWSDDTSMDFLVQLARAVSGLRALVAGSFRPEGEHAGLRRALIDIERARLGRELQVTALSIDEVDQLLREIFNQPHSIRPDFLRAIYELTEGNPFFVEEVVRALIAAGDIYQARGHWTRKDLAQIRIPRSVQDAVTRRAERLGQPATRVLESAAVIGQRFEFALLGRLTGLDDVELLAALRELIDARLIEEESAERLRFRHALIREALYERLLARERRVLHEQVAEALRELHADMPEPWLADLAYHYHAAQRWQEAFQYARAAGERAERLFAPHAAIEQFSRALEAIGQLGSSPPAGLSLRRGCAYETLGSFPEARQDFQNALEIARAAGDARLEWEALIDLGRSWEGLDYERAGLWFERAIELARRMDDRHTLGHSLNRVGNWYLNIERVNEARAAHLEALEIFEELGDESGVAATLDYLGTVGDIGGDVAEMRRRYEQAYPMFERFGDLHRLSSTLASMAVLSGSFVFDATAVIGVASHAEARVWGERGLRLARDIGWRAGEAYALINIGGLDVAMGYIDDAIAHLEASIEIARDIEHGEWLTAGTTILGYLYHYILADDRAVACLEEAADFARRSGSLFFVHGTNGFLIDSLASSGQLERAAAVLSQFSPELPMQTVSQRLLWWARANWSLHAGQPEAALDIADRLLRTGLNVRTSGDIPAVAQQRGLALERLGRLQEALTELEAARLGAVALELPNRLWMLLVDLARVRARLGDGEAARAAAAEARGIIEQIATRIPDDDLRQQYRQKSAAMLARAGFESRPAPSGDPLTRREREIARLVARGLSNRQIADELFISERTVETHVGNILAKLDLNSRTQIAAWVLAPDHANS